MHVIAVFNQKGGVGKTTIAVNLAVTLAGMGYKTVFIDLDFQGDGTRQLWHGDHPTLTVYDLLARRCCAEEAAVDTGFPNLSVVATSRKLSLVEAGADAAGGRQTELRENGFSRRHLDFLVLDCPPSLGRLAANALNAADTLVVPVTPTSFAIEGMKRTLDIYNAVRAGLNPTLQRYRICLSMMDDKPLSRALAAEIASAQGANLLPTSVPYDTDVNKAATYATPAVLYNPDSGFSRTFAAVAVDTIAALGLRPSAGALQDLREQVRTAHRELAGSFKEIAERNALDATVLEAAKEPPAPSLDAQDLTNGGLNGHARRHSLSARFKPYVVGSIIGAAVGFFAGAHM